MNHIWQLSYVILNIIIYQFQCNTHDGFAHKYDDDRTNTGSITHAVRTTNNNACQGRNNLWQVQRETKKNQKT